MNNQKKFKKNPYKYIWVLGFCGFTGFTYFIDHDPSKLYFFIMFLFFGYYFTRKVAEEKPDERMIENAKKAWIHASRIPFFLLLIMSFIAFYFPVTVEFFMTLSSLGFALTVITHQAMLYYYERYT